MPFMFEREGDYTELLIPANVLANDSVLMRSVAVLTEEVSGRRSHRLAIPVLHLAAERRGLRRVQENKAGADEIPLSRPAFHPALDCPLSCRELPRSALAAQPPVVRSNAGQMDYYIAPVVEETTSSDQQARRAQGRRPSLRLGAHADLCLRPAARDLRGRGGTRLRDFWLRSSQTTSTARESTAWPLAACSVAIALDEPGLILADQGATVGGLSAKVPQPDSSAPDKDNVIPIVDGDWFEDDIAARFRTFLRVAFGEGTLRGELALSSPHRLVVQGLRDYFRAIVSTRTTSSATRSARFTGYSPARRDQFDALIYMHR